MIPKLLLLTGVAPGRVDVGRIFLRDLCLLYPHDRICCFSLEVPPDDARSPSLAWLPMRCIAGPYEYGFNRFGRELAQVSRGAYERYVELARFPHVVKQAVEFGKQHCVDLVWATLHSPNTIRAAKAVAASLNVPLITTVWDPPAYKLGSQFGMAGPTLAHMLALFDTTVRGAARCGVASPAMKARYTKKYGTPCVPMIYAVRSDRAASAAWVTPRPDMSFVIGYAGSMYARREWQAFLNALGECDWRVGGRDVMLRVLGSRLDLDVMQRVQIEFLGWRSTADTVRLLSQMDAAYLPYWFDPTYEEVVQLAFPSKLATNVAAGIPTFFHGPSTSSPNEFLSRHPVGLGCSSLEAREIINCLERLATPEFLRAARLACSDAYREELSPTVFRERFAELVGVDSSDLLPLKSQGVE